MARTTVPRHRDAEALSSLLDTPEIRGLIADLEATRWTGRPGYPIRAMVGMALVKSLHAIPTWTRVVALVADHAALRAVFGCAPSLDACYRFTGKLRQNHDRLTECIESVLESLRAENPAMGETVAIDGSDLPAYANGQRFLYNHGPERKTLQRPRCHLGPPLGHLHPEGWRVLRVQGPRACRTWPRSFLSPGRSSRPTPLSRLWCPPCSIWLPCVGSQRRSQSSIVATTTLLSTRRARPETFARSSPCARLPW